MSGLDGCQSSADAPRWPWWLRSVLPCRASRGSATGVPAPAPPTLARCRPAAARHTSAQPLGPPSHTRGTNMHGGVEAQCADARAGHRLAVCLLERQSTQNAQPRRYLKRQRHANPGSNCTAHTLLHTLRMAPMRGGTYRPRGCRRGLADAQQPALRVAAQHGRAGNMRVPCLKCAPQRLHRVSWFRAASLFS